MSTKIEWVKNRDGSKGVSWNPVVGCTHAGSPGCDNCYAREMHNRRHKAYLASKKMPEQYAWSFDIIQLIDERMCLPLHWRKPKTVFVNSVSDLFHPEVPNDFIHCVYDVMGMAKQHTFIVCTKRPERIIPALYDSGYLGQGDYLPNVYHLCTVENQEWADKRIPELLRLKEYSSGWPVLGISVEPMLGPVDIRPWLIPPPVKGSDCWGIDWVICGTESGPKRRPANIVWILSLKDQCVAAGVPFFLKQMEVGRRLVKMPKLEGKIWNEMLEVKV